MLNVSISKLFTTRAVWMLGVGAVVLVGVASGQAQRPDATLDELVVEVQAMRADMNQAAAASIRAQLLVGRLQLEDQRIAAVMRDLEGVQAELASVAQARAESASRLKSLDDALLSATTDVREDAEKQMTGARAGVQQIDRRQQGLKRRETALAKELQDAQARWQDINGRLETFEQSMQASR